MATVCLGADHGQTVADAVLSSPRYRGRVLWMLLVIAVAIVIGWSRGGRLRNLSEIRVRIWWLLAVGFGLQTVAIFLPNPTASAVSRSMSSTA